MMGALSSTKSHGWMRKSFASLARWPGWIRLEVDGWRERYRLRREFDNLELQGELGRTLLDSGIAPSDVPRLMHAHPRTAEQLAEMIKRLGIDRVASACNPATAEALRAMEWRCGECADWRKCRTWLDGGDSGESYRAFCPNAEALDELRTAGAPLRQPCGVLAELAARSGERKGG